MTSPIDGQTTAAQAIDRWLTIVKQDKLDDEAESRGESDYENCQAMQQQIRDAARNCNHLFTSNKTSIDKPTDNYVPGEGKSDEADEEKEEDGDDDDEDYYADSGSIDENCTPSSSASASAPSSSSSSSSLNTNLELTERGVSLDESKLICAVQPEEKQRKEITLKVVIDENETDKSGEEVFYINPLVSFHLINLDYLFKKNIIDHLYF